MTQRKCPRCEGKGDIGLAFMSTAIIGDCPDCEGTGKQHKETWSAGNMIGKHWVAGRD